MPARIEKRKGAPAGMAATSRPARRGEKCLCRKDAHTIYLNAWRQAASCKDQDCAMAASAWVSNNPYSRRTQEPPKPVMAPPSNVKVHHLFGISRNAGSRPTAPQPRFPKR